MGVARKYVPCNELKLNLIYCLSAGMKFMTSVSVREREPRFHCACVCVCGEPCAYVCVCVSACVCVRAGANFKFMHGKFAACSC